MLLAKLHQLQRQDTQDLAALLRTLEPPVQRRTLLIRGTEMVQSAPPKATREPLIGLEQMTTQLQQAWGPLLQVSDQKKDLRKYKNQVEQFVLGLGGKEIQLPVRAKQESLPTTVSLHKESVDSILAYLNKVESGQLDILYQMCAELRDARQRLVDALSITMEDEAKLDQLGKLAWQTEKRLVKMLSFYRPMRRRSGLQGSAAQLSRIADCANTVEIEDPEENVEL